MVKLAGCLCNSDLSLAPRVCSYCRVPVGYGTFVFGGGPTIRFAHIVGPRLVPGGFVEVDTRVTAKSPHPKSLLHLTFTALYIIDSQRKNLDITNLRIDLFTWTS